MIFYGPIKNKNYLHAFLIHSHTLLSYLVITIIIFLLCFIAKLILVWVLSPPTKSFASKQQEYPLFFKTVIRFVFTHVRSVSLNNKSFLIQVKDKHAKLEYQLMFCNFYMFVTK